MTDEETPTTRPVNEIMSQYPCLKLPHVKHATNALRKYLADIGEYKLDGAFKKPYKPYLQDNIHKFKKGSGWWVKSLKHNENIIKNVLAREEKWKARLNDQSLNRDFWNTQYRMVHKINFDNKIHIVQFQIMKGNIKTNTIIHKFKPQIQEECSFGCRDKETIEHLFFKCPEVQKLIAQVNKHMKTWSGGDDFNAIKDFLFMKKMKKLNIREVSKLMIKYFIWRTRCSRQIEDLNLENLKSYIYNFMLPHKKAGTLDFLQASQVWKELEATE